MVYNAVRLFEEAMDHYLQEIFVREIRRQAQFSLMALDEIHRALAENQTEKLWFSVQALLIAVGNVSKVLWPMEEVEERGRTLRHLLGLSKVSVLESRAFRNHFEHFDERLEAWATSSATRAFVDSNVGPPGCIGGIDASAYLRNFDNLNFAVTFGSDTYSLEPIARAIVELRERADLILGTH